MTLSSSRQRAFLQFPHFVGYNAESAVQKPHKRIGGVLLYNLLDYQLASQVGLEDVNVVQDKALITMMNIYIYI